MAHLIKIGNSHGIRIPQALIKQANLQDREFEFHVVDDGLLITPIKNKRQGWKEQFKKISAAQSEQDFNNSHVHLDHSPELPTGEEWEW
ncbi:AbrB/MazE/SpoVT family DNA-binding domain-containing protein [Candidatus Methylobacter oryzae]|uniref:AbrB/MazE/SpoVT family DNA-binding domain-containing protein n=1 Tax=Candidatus Methylobacter oryzae TaxID=2497749 RepID=A0ABY3C8V5_9GAMM|nr:AbrB/MazE/SpoVT family DNA-binding domain-containing protein [Candidatus Methylobacter oryzae]TRW92828.1 AbrB/MazE/SpoVT family DNA-binding domain-containing protein [Candidatus Methylobacter oryzae]